MRHLASMSEYSVGTPCKIIRPCETVPLGIALRTNNVIELRGTPHDLLHLYSFYHDSNAFYK